jgi:diguanylate cyclase (GGDEF)-like protein
VLRSGSLTEAADAPCDRRLAAIEELRLLDRIGDPALTALTRLAQAITGAEAAAVHIFDADYQRRIAAVGAPLVDHPQADSMCRVVLREEARIITRDATAERQFQYSSFVQDPIAPVRFYASVPLHVGGGVAVGTVCAFDTVPRELSDRQIKGLEDIAELARAHLELVKVATDLGQAAALDPLTEAVNRVIFHDRLAQALARRRRRDMLILVAMIDLNDFKALNDTHGHECGDAALRWTADRLKACLRAADTVGRLGGDEFAIVAETDEHGVDSLLERIRGAPEGFTPPFALTVGAVVAVDGDDVDSVIQRADQAMYGAKPREPGRALRVAASSR